MSISDPITAQIDDRVETCPSTPAKEDETTPSLGGLISATAPLEGGECYNDGSRTPTSSPHRIPEIRPCPRAPKKQRTRPKSMGRKRKGSPGNAWMNDDRQIPILLDLTNEVEAMFPPVVRANLTSKIKKARSEVLI